MGFLTNQWTRYFTRSYQQLKSLVITDLASLTPEITDHNESNPYIKALSIWSGIAEMLGYYIDNAAREAFLDSCRRYASAIKIAKLMDYRVLGCNPASADVTFYLNSAATSVINIPINTEVQTADGLKFYTSVAATIAIGDSEVTISCVQAETVSNQVLGISTGLPSQIFTLSDSVVNNSIAVKINSISWTPKDTFGYSLATAQDYVTTVDENGVVIIRFGDGESGVIPTAGDTIIVDFKTCVKEAGNVDAETINSITGAISVPSGFTINCINRERASGGSGVESLQSLKKRIPLYLRTLRRAVTNQDYIDVAEQASGVVKAGVKFNCGKTVDVYIVPTGGGIASGTLLTNVYNWFFDKRMITTRVRTFSAGEVHILLTINLFILPQYTQSIITANVLARLTNFLSYANQKIGGIVQLSDIYEIIERTEGVNYSEIKQMTSRSYARPLDNTSPQLNWTRVTKTTSVGTNLFKIIMLTSTSFQLSRNAAYIGTFNVGDVISLTDIEFTVNAGAYSLGNGWEFYTYDYYGSIVLAEPSLPIALNSDIIINSNGGI